MALGKGLDALLGDTALLSQNGGSVSLPISQVEPGLNQPRKHFDEESLADLSESIRQHGILQPLTVRRLASGLIGLAARIRLVKDREAALEKTYEVLDTYHTAIYDLFRSPAQLLLQCLCSALSMLALTGSIVFVYYAFGLSGTPWYHLLTLGLLLFVSASYTPLPGASGAQEGGFMRYFDGIFPGGTKGLALLIWRFFTYYLFLFVGVITVLLEKAGLYGHARRQDTEPDHTEDTVC